MRSVPLKAMTTFRDFIKVTVYDSDPRRVKFARANASLAGLIVATGGLSIARMVDGSVLVVMLLAAFVAVVGVAVMLGISYAVFRRGETEK